MSQLPLCVYHAKCTDGFAAAWVVWGALKGEVNFHEGYYNAAPPDVDDRDIIVVDFSYPRDVMQTIVASCRSLVLLDHHKTAMADLSELCPTPDHTKITFDMSRSGAGLAWDHFHPGMPRPLLVDLVEVRDLWLRNHPRWEEARLMHAYINSYPFGFYEFSKHVEDSEDQKFRPFMMREGAAILRQHDRDVEEMIGATKRRMKIGGYDVPVANLGPMLASDAGHLMSKGEPFSASYFDGARGRLFSLRSADDGLDVSEIAKSYGGGGHAHAAGFKVELGWNGDP